MKALDKAIRGINWEAIKEKASASNAFLAFVLLLPLYCLASSIYLYKNQELTAGTSSRVVLVLGILSAVFLLVCIGIYAAIAAKRSQTSAMNVTFPIILLVSGMSFACLFPPATAPDEGSHANVVYAYSNVITGKERPINALILRDTDKELFDTMSTVFDRANIESVKRQFQILSDDNSFSECDMGGRISTSLSNLPQLRIMPAVGVSVGQLFGLSGLLTFYLGRIFNFLSFAIMAYTAYRLTPIGKGVFLAMALTPMTLYATSSLSYDAGLMGLAILLVALCLRCKYQTRAVSLRQMIAVIVVAMALAPCKLAYCVIAIMALLIPNSQFKETHQATLFKILALGLPLLSLLAFQLSTLFAIAGIDGANINDGNRGFSSSEFNTLSDAIDHPLHTLYVYVNTIRVYGDFLLSSFLGYDLAWFQPNLAAPQFFMLPYLGALFIAAQKCPEDQADLSFKTKSAFFIIVALGFFAITSSMYLAWTLKTENQIGGLQGRYYLPFAPLLFLLFRAKNCIFTSDPRRYALFGLTALNLSYLTYIFSAASVV